MFNLAEMNNALPNLDQRTELANHLFTVFSTAAYCILFSVQNESSVLQWLVPGLDRIRLDFIESGDNRRVREVEQFLSDLYSKLRLNDQGRSCTGGGGGAGSGVVSGSSIASATTGGGINANNTTSISAMMPTTSMSSTTPTTSDHTRASPPDNETKKSQSRIKNSRFTFRRH
ncbi:unnamed protein product [Trichobilharzia regenti]|nr:unnamed protein product [Trichobilharzia regenti]